MALTLVDMAHYGRHYAYVERRYPLWWYDRRSGKAISIDTLLKEKIITDVDAIDLDALEEADILPFFQFDILSLERKYADEYFDLRLRRALRALTGKELDRAFMQALDSRQQTRHWYSYELAALTEAAVAWAARNHIRYDKNGT